MATRTNGQWRLAARPEGLVKETDFSWRDEPAPTIADGQALVRTVYLSLDPTNRMWASDAEGYMPPVQLGEIMRGLTLGVIVESKAPSLPVGAVVSGMWGWQSFAAVDPSSAYPVPQLPGVPLLAYMAVLNLIIGGTAYFGLLEIGQAKAGETLVVSAAAGAVGSVVGQIGKLKGLRVIGIAGSDGKCRWLRDDLGFDGAINYKRQDVAAELKRLCPGGVDINFESVGGPVMDAVISNMRQGGRVVLCGLISAYNDKEPPPGPRSFGLVLLRRLRIQGFIVTDYLARLPEALQALAGWLKEGKLKYRVDQVEGLRQAPAALNRLFRGDNTGKLVVRVSDEP